MAKTRLLLDTCAVIDLITSSDETDVEFWDIFDDPDTMPYASFETARELVVHFNNKTLLSKHWQTAKQMLTSIEQDYGIEFLPLRRDTAFTYADLQLNEEQDHRDPSDHVIMPMPSPSVLRSFPATRSLPFTAVRDSTSWNINQPTERH